MTMVLYFYNQAFRENDFGYGAAIAWGIFVVVVLFAILNWRLIQRPERAEVTDDAPTLRADAVRRRPAAVGALITLFPYYWLVVMATNTTPDIFTTPPKLTFGSHLFDNIAEVLLPDRLLRLAAQHA